jgi:chorismate synthase
LICRFTVKIAEGVILVQRLRAQRPQDVLQLAGEPHAPELARIVEGQPPAVIELNQKAMVFRRRRRRWLHQQVAAHTQVDQQKISG